MKQDNSGIQLDLTDLNDIVWLAEKNRYALESLKARDKALGVCCNPILAEIEQDQYMTEYYLDQLRQQQRRIDLGNLVLVVGIAATSITSLGAWVWYQYQKLSTEKKQAEADIAKNTCVANAIDRGYDDTTIKSICSGTETEEKESLTETIQKYMGYAMILGLVYITIKIVK